jgi:hypothetical protein
VGVTVFEGLVGIESWVNAAVDDPCAALARYAAHLVSAKSVAGVDADADDVSGGDGVRDNLLQTFIDEDGVAGDAGCGCCNDKEPSGRDDGGAEGIVARIDEMDANGAPSFSFRCCNFQESGKVAL